MASFNAAGREHRDCPICFRVGTLTGDRVAGAELSCSECRARFSYAPATSSSLATLTRLEPITYRAPLDVVCERCGRKHCACGDSDSDARFPGYSRPGR